MHCKIRVIFEEDRFVEDLKFSMEDVSYVEVFFSMKIITTSEFQGQYFKGVDVHWKSYFQIEISALDLHTKPEV